MSLKLYQTKLISTRVLRASCIGYSACLAPPGAPTFEVLAFTFMYVYNDHSTHNSHTSV